MVASLARDDPARRPWWKRKRWWGAAALALWLLILYPLSAGPAWYGSMRGWLPNAALHLYTPLFALETITARHCENVFRGRGYPLRGT